MAATAAWGPTDDAPISRSLQNTLVYVCAKFDAFMKKCTILQLSRCTNRASAEVALLASLMEYLDSKRAGR